MKRILEVSAIIVLVLLVSASISIAEKPGVNPNGFPSGDHYNLNIIGKKDNFNCPVQKYYLSVTYCGCGAHQIGDLVESCDDLDICEQTTIPIYGNVIFVPENGEGIEIYMESGKGKKAAEIPTLQVTDPCAGFDGDGAVLQLPKNEAGYSVYARALAKPTNDPNISITPELIAVEDENGNDLVYLGLVTDRGFETPYVNFIRKKGKSQAINITGLFLWSGDVCYLTEPETYQTIRDLCCIDLTYPPDGIFDECIDAILDPNTGIPLCPEGYDSILAYCNEYTDEWVFNIGDFVTYLWNVDNNGVKLLQVRFYPN